MRKNFVSELHVEWSEVVIIRQSFRLFPRATANQSRATICICS